VEAAAQLPQYHAVLLVARKRNQQCKKGFIQLGPCKPGSMHYESAPIRTYGQLHDSVESLLESGAIFFRSDHWCLDNLAILERHRNFLLAIKERPTARTYLLPIISARCCLSFAHGPQGGKPLPLRFESRSENGCDCQTYPGLPNHHRRCKTIT